MQFDPHAYGPVFAPLLAVDRWRPLDRGLPDRAMIESLGALELDHAFAHAKIVDEPMARCCVAGVWLLYDFLDESHAVSQAIDTAEGSLWHGVMHRREGDFGNAKYWFGRAGDHATHADLAARFGAWDPQAFVDDCQAALRTGDDTACRDRQQAEWEQLFDWCYGHATGSG